VEDLLAHQLRLHLVSVHCNAAAMGLSDAEAVEEHHHEHYGPGGFRHHRAEDHAWSAVKFAEVLREAAEMG
jgi:hypothetical protein